MSAMWKAQVRAVPSAGFCEVRRQGETMNRRVAIGRHMTAAVVGDWVLVVEDRGQGWAVMLLGTGPTALPPNPDPGGGTGPSELVVPPAWAGHTVLDNPSGKTWWAAGWTFGNYDIPSMGYDQLFEAMGLYLGIVGLAISAASLTIVAPSQASTTARLALYSLPEDEPTGILPAGLITRLANVAGPVFPTPAAGTTVAIPESWVDQLSAGTANGVGVMDPTLDHYVHANPPSLTLTYQ